MPGAERLTECDWQWFGCPHCESSEAEDYGFTFYACDMFEEGAEDRGAYCTVCNAFISLEDAKRWLETNDPITLRDIKRTCRECTEEYARAKPRLKATITKKIRRPIRLIRRMFLGR